ncbi:hypothetical protein ACJ41O_011981 [Fusarium nematophilum]
MVEHTEYRPALGLPATLGALHDVLLGEGFGSILFKTAAIPPDLIIEQDLARQTYHHPTAGSLEEKPKKLGTLTEFRVSIMCGMLDPGRIDEYLSQTKSSDRLQQASAVCTLRTKYEKLHLGASGFVRTIPLHVRNLNKGKDVPVTVHLLPLGELARSLRLDLARTHLGKRLDGAIDCAIKRLVELETVFRSLSDYLSLLKLHSSFIPGDQIRKARRTKRWAEADEEAFKRNLKETIVGIYGGLMEWGIFGCFLSKSAPRTAFEPLTAIVR